jgi:hypothetical protein
MDEPSKESWRKQRKVSTNTNAPRYRHSHDQIN